MRSLLPLLLCAASLAMFLPTLDAQAVRFDYVASTTSAQCVSGVQCPILALPGTRVNICGTADAATLASCLGAPATTYTTTNAGTPCPTTSQLTPQSGGACTSTSDSQGNYGFWAAAGLYSYYLRVPATAGGGTYHCGVDQLRDACDGPFPINIGSSTGCPSNATCDANYATLPLACTAAGSGTLYVSRVWTGVTTQSFSCSMNFLGTGRIIIGASQAITVNPNFVCAAKQQCFDATTNSNASVAFTSRPAGLYPEQFGADPTGVTESYAQIVATVSAAAGAPVYFTGKEYKVTGSIASPSLGQMNLQGNCNAVPITGTISGVPPGASTIRQYQANAKTISLLGLGNVVNCLALTINTGVTGVTAIYGTDTMTQPFSSNRITNNILIGYSNNGAFGTKLAAGLDIESIGANSNFNIFTGNIAQNATVGYKLNGLNSGAVVNANTFNNAAQNNTTAAALVNSSEANFTLSMEGNGTAVTGSGVCCTNFYLDEGEQAVPHLILSGGSHDNTLWSAQRGQNSPGDSAMTVTSDSQVNSLQDLAAFWLGVSSSVPGQRYACFACVFSSSNLTPNMATFQLNTDASGTRPPFRIGDFANNNTTSNVSFSPNGIDSTGNYYGFYFATSRAGSFDPTKPVSTTDLWSSTSTYASLVKHEFRLAGNARGRVECSAAAGGNVAMFTDCGFSVLDSNGTMTEAVKFVGNGGMYPLIPYPFNFLPTCAATYVPYNQVGAGAVIFNYPFATSSTAGAAPGTGGTNNVMIRCDFDGVATYAWHIH